MSSGPTCAASSCTVSLNHKGHNTRLFLLVAQALYGIKLCRLLGRIVAKKDSSSCGKEAGKHHDLWREFHPPAQCVLQHRCPENAEHHPKNSAQHAYDHSFTQELKLDVPFSGADGHADSDLPCSLRNRDQHDVHNPYATDHKRQRSSAGE